MLQVSTEPIQLPQDQRVPRLKRAQTGHQPWPVVTPAGSQILINAPALDAGCREGIALEVETWLPSALETRAYPINMRRTVRKDTAQGASER